MKKCSFVCYSLRIVEKTGLFDEKENNVEQWQKIIIYVMR